MNNIIIYDENILEEEVIQQITLDSYRCPYFFNTQITSPLIEGKTVIGNGKQRYLVSGRNDAQTISHVEEIGKYILNKTINKYDLKINKILDIRSHIYMPSLQKEKTDPHIKLKDNNYILIYNVDNNNIVVYNETFDTNKFYSIEDLTIKESFDAKSGSILLFNGLNYHSIVLPKIDDTSCFIFISLEMNND